MRNLCFLFLLCCGCRAWAQSPEGILFYFTGPGGFPPAHLACIEYPEETFSVVDTIQLEDVAAGDARLYAASYIGVIIYNTTDLQAVDTLPGAYARSLAVWNGNLAVASIAHPFFRVYDAQSHSLLFSLDSTKVSYTPSEILIDNDKAYLMLSNTVVVVDLALQDTLAGVATPHPYPSQGYNYFMVDGGDDLYIDVEYATGALRFSMLRMNKSSYFVETVFHREGYSNYSQPVVAGDWIYLLGFDSHYDIALDSLFISADQSPLCLEFDEGSEAVFLYYNNLMNGIGYFASGSFSDTILIQGYLAKALFVPEANDTVNGIIQTAVNSVKAYPNPFSEGLNIEFELSEDSWVKLEIFNIAGERVAALMDEEVRAWKLKRVEYKPNDSPGGIIICRLQTEQGIYYEKAVMIRGTP